jgi:protein-disulfide isomerase
MQQSKWFGVLMALLLAACAASKNGEERDAIGEGSAPKPVRPAARRGTPVPKLGDIYRVEIPATAPSIGPRDAKVTVVVFSEFQCPFCARHRATLKRLRDEFPGDVRLVFRHNPLAFHTRAFPAAVAAVAAGEQGKFWEMYDALFDNQRALGDADFLDHARAIGISEDQFKADLMRADIAERIRADESAARSLGAGGVPATFVNGRYLSGAQPFETFRGVVEEETARANKVLATGVRAADLYDALVSKGKERIALPLRSRQVEDENAVYRVPTADAPWRGPKDAKVTIVVYSDFQCPFCGRALKTLDRVLREFPSVKLVFRHHPLPFHTQARPAAQAAWAAWQQGKFWEMHDLLFAGWRALEPADLERYASTLGLDIGRFKQDMESAAAKKTVDDQVAETARLGAGGTPTFFVNGKKLVGAQPFDRFAERVKKAVAEADALLANGVKLADIYDEATRNGLTQKPKP